MGQRGQSCLSPLSAKMASGPRIAIQQKDLLESLPKILLKIE